MVVETASRSRVRVDGKFFRLDGKKIYVKGLTYGPFAPNAQNEPFAFPEQTRADFVQIREADANLVRVYHTPPRWFLDLAQEYSLKVLIDIPWDKKSCFLDSARTRQEVREMVGRAVTACARHPAVFAFSVANEIPPDIVRWSGAKAITKFVDELILEARRIDPEGLYTCTNFPPTEFLHPREVDFVCFNVYLHYERPFKAYLAHLQMLAQSKPLLLGEFGMDSLREGELRKCETLTWQTEGAFRAGLAGTVVFSFTDDWFKEGQQIEDWQMGLTTRNRQPKKSFHVVGELFRKAPYFPSSSRPKVSVVVASYNSARTLKPCLESLTRLNYPDYEVILVDDGSTDSTAKVVAKFPQVNCVRHEKNLGLSSARNTGIGAASGEIIAFTDADCRADEDWLYYLVGDLVKGEFAGLGGPNLLPPEDSPVATAVMVSPGGPAHVMLDDRVAEHIPGCNMAFFKSALREIGGFDPVFHRAGDDVDICWRLQQAGYRIGFTPAAFVWHYRRSTARAYLKQQHGYGEAEALLARKHPEYFTKFGGIIWHGHIYTSSKFGVLARKPVIYHGLFG
ncbi:MAG TPA: glycosyltransferase, partial [Verrucomicrobiae bacterium]|nr:glycosyltransferase [Verrucomicrobiae bacterium]